jgi:hypothetical protein
MEPQVMRKQINLLERMLWELHSHHARCAIEECEDPRCKQVSWGLSWLKRTLQDEAPHARMACGY